MDNERLFKTLSEIVDVASQISAMNLRNRKTVEELIACEAERDHERAALTELVQCLSARLSVDHAA
jgi:hypothetical protein